MEADESTIVADRQRLEYALGNLLDNALIHGAGDMSAGRSAHVGDAVTIRVRDHGTGFSDSYLAHPFVRFAPTSSTGRGTGLGLAIVHAITEAHGGVVSVANDVGASVTLSLPTDPARPVAVPGSDPSCASRGQRSRTAVVFALKPRPLEYLVKIVTEPVRR